jgi:phosphatidylinositol alpha-1,6-mannosyltransferase
MRRRVVSLVSDAFGGRGGIAAYSRFFLKAVCSHPEIGEVVALPRVITYELEAMPSNLRFEVRSAGSKFRYAGAVAALAARVGSASLVTCSHLNLLPFAHMLGLRFRCPVLPLVYGLEAIKPTRYITANYLCRRLDAFIAIRKRTADRLKRWAGIPNARFYYLPNCIDVGSYGLGPKRADLCQKYGLEDRTVIMTAGRVDSNEKNKGFDEVLETLPILIQDVPQAVYLIMGDGDDRPRLEQKARALGVADRVIFAGYVPEAEKADHYRLADVVAMPGSSPYHDRYPFRFTFLEPLACGIPVVASQLEDAYERDDPDVQQLLIQVNPDDPADINRGILEALAKRGRGIEPALSKFTYEAFEQRAHAILSNVFERSEKFS